jgi:superfamily II DNA or RNA helicase
VELNGQSVHHQSPPESKIALFRALFRGREDVYPQRYENRMTGKAGYQPACGNEWARGICEKPRIKCSECTHQKFLPLTDHVIRWHLSGMDDSGQDFVMGIYPMLRDETCYLLAIDLNKPEWPIDGAAMLKTCQRMGVSAAFERSRSGRGGHIWLFFEQAIPTTLARKLGAHILTETMECRPEIGLDAYDRFFPNQDTLPQGKFGSVIALPLQKRARDNGNSLFINELHQPYPDQWDLLSRIEKIPRLLIEDLISTAEKCGRIMGVRSVLADDLQDSSGAGIGALQWATPCLRQKQSRLSAEFSGRLDLRLGSQLSIHKAGLPPDLRNRLIRLGAFQNPEFYQAQSMRLPTYGKPRIISCAKENAEDISLPRGCLEDVQDLLSRLKIESTIRDERQVGQPLQITFQGELRPEQEIAAQAIAAHEMGILCATTAFGKTVVAAALIAKRGVNVLILVHRRQLLEQWIERLASFLGLPPKSIGRIGGGRKKPTGLIDVALIQSLIHKGKVNEVVENYGHLIIDECHHLSAQSFEQVVRQAKPRFVLGLSATITRKDGHHPIIFMQCGPIRHRVDALAQAVARPFEHVVCVRPTDFRSLDTPSENIRVQFRDLYPQLVRDAARNSMICGDVIQSVREGRSPLVITERNEHLDMIATRLSASIQNVIVLRGGQSRKLVQQAMTRLAEIPEEQGRVLLATGRYIGEGFDDPRLDTLFLTLPVSWHGTIAQYVGRLHRLHDRKKEVRVYDYADLNVPMLSRMFDRRCRGYEAVGYQIQLPASAVPGWPTDVPLPVDPQWKDAFAATIRRLCIDGVNQSLANLFVAAVQTVPAAADGSERARSASEAFLFNRLQTLPETKGRFTLNADLSIPFDGRGQMEVDLVCLDSRIVIELDGAQHLESVDAYRRDRRKDLLLQETGYFVLRFLSQDVGTHLDLVLDTILRALSHCQSQRSLTK